MTILANSRHSRFDILFAMHLPMMKYASCFVLFFPSDAELENRLQEAGTLHRAAAELCHRRACQLQKALDIAEHLHCIVSDISSQLSRILEDSAAIRSGAATDRTTIQHHLTELQAGNCVT